MNWPDGLWFNWKQGLKAGKPRLLFAPMKFVLGSAAFLFFALLLVAGIVRASYGSSWLLIVSSVLFIGLMLKCCLPVKH